MSANRMKDGDVLLLTDGRLLQVIDTKVDWSDLSAVQFLDRDEVAYVSLKDLDVDHNLGQEAAILLGFSASRSIHVRLNRINKV